MIQRNLKVVEGLKSIRFSHRQFCFRATRCRISKLSSNGPTVQPVESAETCVGSVRHEVAQVIVPLCLTTKEGTHCSVSGSLPRHAFGAIRWYEALGTTYPAKASPSRETTSGLCDMLSHVDRLFNTIKLYGAANLPSPRQ